jgi:type III pantothenate kinase
LARWTRKETFWAGASAGHQAGQRGAGGAHVKLPRFELIKPDTVIGRTTVANLQSGLIYGYIGQVDIMVKRIRAELKAPDAFVVATGGMAVLVAQDDKFIDKLDGLLTLKGLRILYDRNR